MAAWLAAAVGVGVLAQTIDDNASPDAPHAVHGQVAEPVSAGSVTLEVTGVRTTTSLAGAGGVVPSEGAFVLVQVRFTTEDRPVYLSWATLVDARGREYEVTSRVTSFGSFGGPVIEVERDLIFEVPLDALGPMELVVFPQRPVVGSFGEARLIPVHYLNIALTTPPPTDDPLLPLPPEPVS